MKSLPTAPAPGTPVSSSLIRELIDAIRARTLLRGHGYRTRETPNGTFLDIDPQPQSKPAKKIPGCWQYVPPTETESGTFKFPYFIVGARLYRAKDEEIAFADAFEDCIVCVDVDLTGTAPAVTIKTPEDFSGVQALQAVDGHSVHPLYQFEGNAIVCDFRNIPNMGAWEFQE